MAEDSSQPAARPKANKAKRQLIGFKQRIEINEQRARETAGTPDNIISRKGFVAGAFALVIYAYYVFVGRLCAPMLQKKKDAKGSVGEGVGLLIAFNILWLMFVWTYMKISFTSPGWAAELVPKASAPEESMFTTTNTGTPYQYIGTTPEGNLHAQAGSATVVAPSPPDLDKSSTMTAAQEYASAHRRSLNSMTSVDETHRASCRIPEDEDLDIDPSDLDGPRNMLPAEISLFTKGRSSSHPTNAESTAPLGQGPSSPTLVSQISTREPSPPVDPDHSGIQPSDSSNSRSTMGVGGGYRVSDVSNIETCDSHTPLQPIAEVPSTNGQGPTEVTTENSESSTPFQRSASGNDIKRTGDDPERMQAALETPAVQPQQPEWLHERPLPPHYPGLAYCRYCRIFKPHRTHHCRHCGTCVLAMDHHCPWIGQCVGWRNHKFFIIFCGWSTLFTLYITVVFATKLGTGSLDGQMLALIIVGGFFSVFTFTMTLSHIAMACSAMTTIESYSIRDQRDRESHLLAQKYGFFKWRTKTRTLRRWNHEYGDLKTEGNRWYVGGPMREWKLLMGDDPLGWIFPIGQAKADGIHWKQNPRFGPNGERRKRHDWPENLR